MAPNVGDVRHTGIRERLRTSGWKVIGVTGFAILAVATIVALYVVGVLASLLAGVRTGVVSFRDRPSEGKRLLAGEADAPLKLCRNECMLGAVIALYAILADRGFFPVDELRRFLSWEGILGGHPDRNRVPGIEASIV